MRSRGGGKVEETLLLDFTRNNQQMHTQTESKTVLCFVHRSELQRSTTIVQWCLCCLLGDASEDPVIGLKRYQNGSDLYNI